ncbi:hypothetical protein SAY86_031475 [Trapa natans]|uniref:Uncharacterized protein n=1 Tax=Trapa natans TaxID=22666 RepID=A0AAN7M393_TRANT|nr:hypothetical protein SAY86_031475 [Trapa natans]
MIAFAVLFLRDSSVQRGIGSEYCELVRFFFPASRTLSPSQFSSLQGRTSPPVLSVSYSGIASHKCAAAVPEHLRSTKEDIKELLRTTFFSSNSDMMLSYQKK